jgi:urea carboxylase
LLRFFDQLRFFPVSAAELLEIRAAFPYGQYRLRTEDTTLRLADYRRFLQDNAASIADFRQQQRSAFDAERERWQLAGHSEVIIAASDLADSVIAEVPAGCVAITAPVTGSVWQVPATAGAQVQADERLVVLESMKMEIAVCAEVSGTVVEVRCAPGRAVNAGATLLILKPAE